MESLHLVGQVFLESGKSVGGVGEEVGFVGET